jgi:hypothetical protein
MARGPQSLAEVTLLAAGLASGLLLSDVLTDELLDVPFDESDSSLFLVPATAVDDLALLSVTYQPEPLKMMPTG